MDRPDSLHLGFLGIAGPMDSSCSSRSLCGHLLCDVHCSSCLLCQGYRDGWCSDCWAQGARFPSSKNETWLSFLLTSGLNPGTPSVKGILAGIYMHVYMYLYTYFSFSLLVAGFLVDSGISRCPSSATLIGLQQRLWCFLSCAWSGGQRFLVFEDGVPKLLMKWPVF